MSSRSWQVATVATATAAAVPLVYWQYHRYIARKERREAIKLLRKVELIAEEVAVRMMHLETRANELVNEEATREATEVKLANPAATSALNSYYHFDSRGNKLKTKWDSFDADAELERLENEERGVQVSSLANKAKDSACRAPQISRSDVLAMSKGIEHEFEAVLSFLDDVRGDKEVKQLRKNLATRVAKEYLSRIDAIQVLLA
uniref:BAG domain-containing protein n=1 Tax=Peronospora matthiolae TaxID=2874970 RepID=A0AAV1UG71_9STRA